MSQTCRTLLRSSKGIYRVGKGTNKITKSIVNEMKWQSTPVLLPGKSHGQRSLVGYSPWGRKELDTTERLHSLAHSCNKALFINLQIDFLCSHHLAFSIV